MRIFALLFVSVLVLAGCTPQKARDPQAMVAAADELDARFVAAFNSGNADSLAATYWNSPDVVSVAPGGQTLRGFEALRSSMPAMIPPGAQLELVEKNNRPEGDVVLGSGTWRMTMTGPDGKPMIANGSFTDVKAERDGRWVYIVDHASVLMPPDTSATH